MRLKYDLDAGALYIGLADAAVARTAQIDEGTLVDLDKDGNVVGIEVTAVERPLPLGLILGSYAVPAHEEAQLRAYFQQGGSAGGMAGALEISAVRIPAVPVPA